MVKKVSLDVKDDSYKELESLSAFYKQNVKDTILNIIDAIGRNRSIEYLAQQYKVPVDLGAVVSHVFEAGSTLTQSLLNEILEKLKVKGLYVLEDFWISSDEDYMTFAFDALRGSNLEVDSFHIQLEHGISGIATLLAFTYFTSENESETETMSKKLKDIVDNADPPLEFEELDGYEIEIEEPGVLTITCTGESIEYLPSPIVISKFVKKILKKAGIKQN